MAAANQPHQTTTTVFNVNFSDGMSTLEMKKTLKSTDEYVQWELILSMRPHATEKDQLELNLEATALTPDTPHVTKFVYATCKLEMSWVCYSCRNNGYGTCRGNYGSCIPRLDPVVVETPLSSNFHFKIRNVKLSSSPSSQVQNSTSRSYCVTVTLRHFKTIEDVPNLSPVGPCVTKNLEAMLQSGEMSDVTFVLDGVEIKAHSQILGASSDVFKAMFQHDTLDKNTGRVEVADVLPLVFEEMLRCVYTDETPRWDSFGEYSEDFLAGLLFLAEKYNLVSLRGRCQRRFLSTMTVDNVVERLRVLHIVSPPMVPLVADPFVRTHLNQVISSEAWTALMVENVDLALNVLFLAVKR